MLNWIMNRRLDMRSKLRIAYDLLYVMIMYRVRELAFLPVACGAMFHLNRYAQQVERHNASPIYNLKNRFVRMLYEFGYCRSVTQQKQILECWACEGTGRNDPWDTSVQPSCWKCGGTGVYRVVTLYRFTFDVRGMRWTWHQPCDLVGWPVDVRGTRWIWHQPWDLVGWPVDVTDEDPEPYRRPGAVKRQTKKEVGRAIVTVWAALRFARRPQPALPGLLRLNERYRRIPFPTGWFENQVGLSLPTRRRLRAHRIRRRIEQIKIRLLRRC